MELSKNEFQLVILIFVVVIGLIIIAKKVSTELLALVGIAAAIILLCMKNENMAGTIEGLCQSCSSNYVGGLSGWNTLLGDVRNEEIGEIKQPNTMTKQDKILKELEDSNPANYSAADILTAGRNDNYPNQTVIMNEQDPYYNNVMFNDKILADLAFEGPITMNMNTEVLQNSIQSSDADYNQAEKYAEKYCIQYPHGIYRPPDGTTGYGPRSESNAYYHEENCDLISGCPPKYNEDIRSISDLKYRQKNLLFNTEPWGVNPKYTSCYKPPSYEVLDGDINNHMSYDDRNTLEVMARERSKKVTDGWASKNADYYKQHFSDELDREERQRWWGNKEF